MLNEYKKQTQRFLRDQSMRFVNPHDLVSYINQARRAVALQTQSVRILSPVSGAVNQASIANPGSLYKQPIVTFSTPDFPSGLPPTPGGALATAVATASPIVGMTGGQIENIAITYGGDGYFQPFLTITDGAMNPTGTGALAMASIQPVMQTINQQEVYPFASVPLDRFPGVGSVYWVNSISIIYAAFRFSFMCYSFSTYQARIRNYPRQYLYVPSVWGQMGRGTNGLVYAYPLSNASYQMEWDCFCLPMDLWTDQDPEAIPQPWQDLVPYFAAHLAFLELQNLNAAEYYRKLYMARIAEFSTWAAPQKRVNPYGRF